MMVIAITFWLLGIGCGIFIYLSVEGVSSILKKKKEKLDGFEVGDIIISDYNFDNPFEQDNCMLIIDKEVGAIANNQTYFAYKYCNRDGTGLGPGTYSDTLTHHKKVGHIDLN